MQGYLIRAAPAHPRPPARGWLAPDGHHGSGGTIAFADRAGGLSFALTRTRLAHPADGTAQLLADIVRAAA
ncbi:hypothetical protein [Streptomyces sp. 3211]|uniref:hypothetical protein n=1 Tax=Streptomyces sp. 3211 TaxID=1964449 RepID=UPI0009A474F8|nr:hypothetical protein [Streptomyces sp. 3211]